MKKWIAFTLLDGKTSTNSPLKTTGNSTPRPNKYSKKGLNSKTEITHYLGVVIRNTSFSYSSKYEGHSIICLSQTPSQIWSFLLPTPCSFSWTKRKPTNLQTMKTTKHQPVDELGKEEQPLSFNKKMTPVVLYILCPRLKTFPFGEKNTQSHTVFYPFVYTVFPFPFPFHPACLALSVWLCNVFWSLSLSTKSTFSLYLSLTPQSTLRAKCCALPFLTHLSIYIYSLNNIFSIYLF